MHLTEPVTNAQQLPALVQAVGHNEQNPPLVQYLLLAQGVLQA